MKDLFSRTHASAIVGHLLAFGLLGALPACHQCSPSTSQPQPPTSATTTSSAPTPALATASAASTVSPQATAGATTLKLRSGATLQLPSNAKAETNAKPLPEEVQNVHIYSWKEPRQLLAITEHVPEPNKKCEDRLNHQWESMQRAKGDTDEARLELRRMGSLEQLTVKGKRVLYSDSMRRGVAGKENKRPFAATAMAIMCEGSDYLAMIYTIKSPELPASTKKMLLDIVGSYAPSSGQ